MLLGILGISFLDVLVLLVMEVGENDRQLVLEAYNSILAVILSCVFLYVYGMSAPFLHSESTRTVIIFDCCFQKKKHINLSLSEEASS